jgi:LysM repeat protein
VNSKIQKTWARIIQAESAKDTAAQKKLLREVIKDHPKDEHGGMAYYRLGVLYWRLGEKRKGEDTWKYAYEHLVKTRGGRLSALALADLWYAHFAGQTPEKAQWEAIRDAYSSAMGMDRAEFIPGASRKRAEARLQKLNQTLVFSRFPCSGSMSHVVKRGDTLDQIARYFGVLRDSIIAINAIKPPYWLREGEKLKILKLPAYILVDKKNLTLTLYLGGKWIKRYPVCVGPDNKTPAGTYSVGVKAPNPDWTDPTTGKRYKSGDSRNIIGSRWIGFDRQGPGKGLGIHGTKLPSSIPGRSSMGCVRLLNADVEELYGFVFKGTEVRVIE